MSAPGLVIGAKVRCGSGTTLWVVERIDRYSVQGRSAAGRRRRIDLNQVRIVEPVRGMETMDIWPSGRIEVDGIPVRYADDYYRTVVDWPAWDLGKGMIGQPSSFGLMVEGGQQPCVRVVADGACGKLPAISTRETAHELALAILELSKHLPE